MSDTIHLDLPYLAASQAQKHVTHNAALSRLDALVQMAVISRGVATPPAAPAPGARYLIAASPTGAWSGKAGQLTFFSEGLWQFIVPREGFNIWVNDENLSLVFNGSLWLSGATPTILQNMDLVGVNATADTNAKLSVASATTLFNHVGAGHQLKINKSASGQTASILLQNAFSGRAEIGLTGDDDFHVKVSDNGSSFTEALTIAAVTGSVTAKQSLRIAPQASDPTPLSDGLLWYNQSTGRFRKRQAGVTTDLDTIGGGLSDGDYGDVTVASGGTAIQVKGASGAFALNGIVTPPEITTDVHNFAPSGLANASVVRLSTDNDVRTISGLSGGTAGRILTLWNIGAYDVVLEDDDTGSLAENRFDFGDEDFFLLPGSSIILNYDIARLRWTSAAHAQTSHMDSSWRRRPVFAADFLTIASTGNPPFTGTAISTGSSPLATTGLDVNHHGIARLTSSTTANSGYRWVTDAAGIKISGSERFEMVFRLQNAATTVCRFGFHDATSSTDAVDGVYFETSSTGAVVGKTASNSVRTTSATIATLALNTWYRAVTTVNRNASSVLFQVFDANGVLLGTQSITTNIPTAAGREVGAGVIATNSGVVATALLDVDYMAVAFGARRPMLR